MAAIAELRARQEATDNAIERLDERVTRHDEIISSLREAVAKVATKDDITELRKDINEQFTVQMRDAHNSVPVKHSLMISAGMFVIAIITLVVSFYQHHG
ncbi:putative holin-like toxin [Burkholderia sp. GbtcB21]|uniref:putative holin-like toxin n=1 Tax=Burkholderia sp. GbtcB21 TaxID=2824766 RepID=UPI001C2F13DF|nr:putative holin-like toxin [Burkholderia sp. GbtcB21]